MATYYPSSANQQDIMPTLYLKEPGHAQYTETAVQGSMYMNYASSGSYPEDIAGSSQNQQNNVELPVPNAATLMQASSMGASALLTSRLGDTQYNSWRDGGSELSFIQMPNAGGSNNRTGELMHTSGTNDPQMGLGTELGILHGQNLSLQQSNIAAVQGKGLSLTLSTQIPAHSLHYHPASSSFSFVGPHPTSGNVGSSREDNSGDKQMHVYQPSYGLSTLSSTLPNSRYLKVAQQLLDEVINVRKALKSKMDINEGPSSAGNAGGKESDEGSKSDGTTANPQESSANSTEVSPTERQDLQNKLTKLSAMLDEVDRRYKQYYHQMQIVVSSFDVIAGFGSAKPYTALALQTISRHFRCLRDAISGQIHATRKSLGEQESPTKGGGLSRLRFVDQQLRQQRAFQQFGMMQQHAWRPQRGLPENSVTILRAWLFEHFLHPYPKDSDKIMLARQTGLTRNQVSNWFINARVRLWKPMVEEMYKEEIGDAELDTNSSSENATKGKDDARSSEDHEDSQSMKSVTEMSQSRQLNNSSRSTALSDMEMNGVATSFKNEVSAEHTSYMNINPRGQDSNTHDNNLLQHTFIQNDGSGRFMDYQVAGLGRYGNAGVSLTLGLQHCEGGLPVSDGQHSFVSVRGDAMLNVVPSLGADAADYNYLNLADNRHRFGPSQLLHDFVA